MTFCSNCDGFCCKYEVAVPLSEKEFQRMHYLAEKHQVMVKLDIQGETKQYWMSRSKSGKEPCGFLNSNDQCIIYDERSEFCKNWFCDKTSDPSK